MPSPWTRRDFLSPYAWPRLMLATDSSANPKADPRLSTTLALSHEEALRARVSYAADHPLRSQEAAGILSPVAPSSGGRGFPQPPLPPQASRG